MAFAATPLAAEKPDYVAYLKRYAGAELTDRSVRVAIMNHGFTAVGSNLSEVGPNIYDFENQSIDPGGIYQFAMVEVCENEPEAT